MSEDMSEMFQKLNDMLKNNQIPDNIKHMMNQVAASSSEASTSKQDASQSSSDFSNFDMATFLKMKAMMDNLNQNQPDPRADLLRSLKPYLRDSRKSKVEEYIKLFRIGKMIEMMGPLGGEKKNDV